MDSEQTRGNDQQNENDQYEQLWIVARRKRRENNRLAAQRSRLRLRAWEDETIRIQIAHREVRKQQAQLREAVEGAKSLLPTQQDCPVSQGQSLFPAAAEQQAIRTVQEEVRPPAETTRPETSQAEQHQRQIATNFGQNLGRIDGSQIPSSTPGPPETVDPLWMQKILDPWSLPENIPIYQILGRYVHGARIELSIAMHQNQMPNNPQSLEGRSEGQPRRTSYPGNDYEDPELLERTQRPSRPFSDTSVALQAGGIPQYSIAFRSSSPFSKLKQQQDLPVMETPQVPSEGDQQSTCLMRSRGTQTWLYPIAQNSNDADASFAFRRNLKLAPSSNGQQSLDLNPPNFYTQGLDCPAELINEDPFDAFIQMPQEDFQESLDPAPPRRYYTQRLYDKKTICDADLSESETED